MNWVTGGQLYFYTRARLGRFRNGYDLYPYPPGRSKFVVSVWVMLNEFLISMREIIVVDMMKVFYRM